MTPRKAPRRSPIVVSGLRARARTRAPRDPVLGVEALDAPVPGSLLVLLSRLARSEGRRASEDDAGG